MLVEEVTSNASQELTLDQPGYVLVSVALNVDNGLIRRPNARLLW